MQMPGFQRFRPQINDLNLGKLNQLKSLELFAMCLINTTREMKNQHSNTGSPTHTSK